tara:strand:+ start:524 stop:1804 length:1281 start_codon:yes stop_codon:yes gene_type:complete
MALTQVKSEGIKDDSIVDADIKSDAAIAMSKLATGNLPSGIVINSSNIVAGAVASGHIANNAVGLTQMAGGTDGQIITYDGNGDPAHVATGNDGQVLTSQGEGNAPQFEDLPTSGAALTGSTNNTVVTVTGSNAMQGEANLHFDGTRLLVGSDTSTRDEAKVQVFGNADTNYIAMENISASDSDGARYGKLIYRGTQSGGEKTDLVHLIAAHDGSSDDQKGRFLIKINDGSDGNSPTERFRISNAGNVTVSDGNLVIGTSGHGIDFSAASGSAGGSASAVLDDYEEGTWTPAFGGTSSAPTLAGYESQTGGWYVKVGRQVTCWFFIYGQTVNSDGSGTLTMTGLPFSASAANDGGEGVATTGWMKVGTECNADDKWAYWRNTGGTNYLKAQSRELSDGSQNNPTQADSLPNSALSVGYISYRTNSV